jgi:diguanylate cyclase (GGDEF)-like protein
MYERHQKISNLLFYILIIFEILLIMLLFFKPHINISFQQDPLYTLNKDWIYTRHNGTTMQVDLPSSLEAGNDDSVSISHTLPKDELVISHLSILSTHQNLEAYIDDQLIYSRINPTSNGLFDLPTSSIWDVIELPGNSEGKTITLIISSDYNNYAGKVSEVYAGTRTGLFLQIIESSGLSLVLSLVTLLLGVVLLIVYHFIKHLLNVNKAMLHLSWFTVLCSTWMLAESDLTQLFISNEYVISGILYLSLMTFPIPMILYITGIDSFFYKNLLYKVGYIFFVIAFLLIILQIFNVMDFLQSSTIVRLEIFFLLALVLILLLMELFKRKNLELKSFTIATTILFTFESIELLTYQRRVSNNGIIFQIGFLIFIGMLIRDALRNIAGIIKLSESAKHYKFLATRDLLTNCRNRIAYTRDLDRLQLDQNITIFIADLNNLKLINDNYGHMMGDEILVLSSQCLLNTFGRRVYRIGGDEFVSLQFDLTSEMQEQLLKDFETECKKANLDSPHPISVSIGYAAYDKDNDSSIYDTINRADKDMYERKEQMKKS